MCATSLALVLGCFRSGPPSVYTNWQGSRIALRTTYERYVLSNGLEVVLNPTEDAFYRFPGQQDSIIGSHYELEIIVPDGYPLGGEIPIAIGVNNN